MDDEQKKKITRALIEEKIQLNADIVSLLFKAYDLYGIPSCLETSVVFNASTKKLQAKLKEYA